MIEIVPFSSVLIEIVPMVSCNLIEFQAESLVGISNLSDVTAGIATRKFGLTFAKDTPDSKVQEANMGPIWGRQDPGGPHVGSVKFAIWDVTKSAF